MSKILIVVPDITRKAHLKRVLPRVLRSRVLCHRSGDVKIIVGTGLHKPHTKAELKNLVGGRIFSKYKVISHTQKKSDLVHKGRTREGIPITLNKKLFEADKIITVGLIEPHLYAGYSGGAKTIAIGLAGEETINATHHPRFLDKPLTAIGSIKNNPFQNCLWEIIEGLPIKLFVNIVNGKDGKLKRIFMRESRGETRDLKREFYKSVEFARDIFEKRLNKTFDAVICEVAPPKDVNMYQASRAFNYVLNTKKPIVKKGGIVLVTASLRGGFGKGIAEKRFAETLGTMSSPQRFINAVKKEGCTAGEHRAYMVAKALTKARLGFIGPKADVYTKGLPLASFPTVKSAIKFIRQSKGRTVAIHIIPNALSSVISQR